jgi:hypothetical protein
MIKKLSIAAGAAMLTLLWSGVASANKCPQHVYEHFKGELKHLEMALRKAEHDPNGERRNKEISRIKEIGRITEHKLKACEQHGAGGRRECPGREMENLLKEMQHLGEVFAHNLRDPNQNRRRQEIERTVHEGMQVADKFNSCRR